MGPSIWSPLCRETPVSRRALIIVVFPVQFPDKIIKDDILFLYLFYICFLIKIVCFVCLFKKVSRGMIASQNVDRIKNVDRIENFDSINK